MQNISKKLIEFTENNKKYHSKNGKSILNFPLNIPMGVSIYDFLSDIYGKYQALVKEKMDLLVIPMENHDYLCEKFGVVCNGILDILLAYNGGRLWDAYDYLKKVIDEGALREISIIIEKDTPQIFYRMRDEEGITDKKQFYHVPFDKMHLTKSYRFSMAGFSCLYIGCSEDVCKKEVGDKGSMIEMTLAKEMKLIDLTWSEKGNEKESYEFLLSWPLIAACYIVPNYCLHFGKECLEIKGEFKEQYVIPQLVSAYIRQRYSYIDGIRYYTTRYENLDPSTTDYMNIALFAKYNPNEKYDMNLIGKFTFKVPYNV